MVSIIESENAVDIEDADGDPGGRSGTGGRWEGVLDASGIVLFLLQVSEVLAEGKGVYRKVNGLRTREVAFFRDNEQAESRAHETNMAELRFRGSNGDKERKGTVSMSARTRLGGRAEGKTVGLF